MPNITCCKNCTNRHFKCHSTCTEYISQRIALDEYKAKEAIERERITESIQTMRRQNGLRTRNNT